MRRIAQRRVLRGRPARARRRRAGQRRPASSRAVAGTAPARPPAPCPAARESRRCSARIGLTSRHTGPTSTDSSGTPTQSSTKTEPAVGFRASSRPKTAATATYAVATTPKASSATRSGLPSSTRCTPAGTGQPAVPGPQPRLPPEQTEREERHDQGDGAADQRVGERDRQVLAAADAVRQQPARLALTSRSRGGQRTSSCSSSSSVSCVSTSNSPAGRPCSSTVVVTTGVERLLDVEAVHVHLVVDVAGDLELDRLPRGILTRLRLRGDLAVGDWTPISVTGSFAGLGSPRSRCLPKGELLGVPVVPTAGLSLPEAQPARQQRARRRASAGTASGCVAQDVTSMPRWPGCPTG